MTTDSSFQGFKAVVAKLDASSDTKRWLFYKRHYVREKIPQKPSDRTLFVINVPPFCNEDSLKQTFSVCGEVSEVFCQEKPYPGVPAAEDSVFFPKNPKPNGYKVAYVVFKTCEGLQKALALNSNETLILSHSGTVESGVNKWCNEYNSKIINPKELQSEIDVFMAQYDAEEKRKEHDRMMAVEADGEGWIVVTSKSRKRGIARTEAARKKILDKEKVKRSKRELKNFYTFQIRESKMKHIETLRRKFEEDKKKVDAFKQSRRFKPF